MEKRFRNPLLMMGNLAVDETKDRDRHLRRSRFFLAGRMVSELSPVLTVVALAEDISAGAALLALNSHPLSCSEMAIAARASFTAPNVGLLSFKHPKLSWRQIAASIAAPDSLLLSPTSLIDGCSPGQVSNHQEDSQAASHRCECPSFHLFISSSRFNRFTVINSGTSVKLR